MPWAMFCRESGLCLQDNGPCHTVHILWQWFEEYGKVLPWPQNSPGLNQIQCWTDKSDPLQLHRAI